MHALRTAGVGIPATNQMHELLRRRFIVVAAVMPALLNHGATNLFGIGLRRGEAADTGGAAVAHDVSPVNFHDNARSCGRLQETRMLRE